ncbi:MAG TPA: hypothetical protein VNY73_01420, partial [Bacteroidia bacterium]|nr:hypothetical protein [Bacteroidia bacterium]
HIKYQYYKHAEDYDLWIQLSKVSKLSNVKGFLLKYRSHDLQGSVVHTGTQKNSSEIIREQYLKDLGFDFTKKELEINTLIATNRLITSEEILSEAENWLLKLVHQNSRLRSIEPGHFNFLMGKTWYDSCGITNLGLVAFKRYFRSPLAKYYPLSSRLKIKLAGKCALRGFRK